MDGQLRQLVNQVLAIMGEEVDHLMAVEGRVLRTLTTSYAIHVLAMVSVDAINAVVIDSAILSTIVTVWLALRLNRKHFSPLITLIVDHLCHRQWIKQLNSKKPSLGWALFKAFVFEFIPWILLFIFQEAVIRVAQPVLLGYVVRYFQKKQHIAYTDAAYCAAGVVLCSAGCVTLNHLNFTYLMKTGMRMRVACCALMFKKSMKLSRSAMGKTTVGQILNMMSNDVNRFDEFAFTVHSLFVAPIQSAVILFLLWEHLSWACFSGLGVIILFIPFQGLMGRLFQSVRRQTAQLTDTRIRIMNEIISGMRVIKMYTWEKPFQDLVADARLKLSAESVFVTMAFFNTLRNTLTKHFPAGIAAIAELIVACHRIQEIIEPTIKDLSVCVKSGELLAVIGPVGSGKSSLLMAILNELSLTGGSLEVRGKVSYAPQESWAFISSVRDNILFGSEYNEEKYNKVVHVCALDRDFKLFPFGDKTLCGERGVSLSGGQKARITLARALYHEADVYLLDDPLSAVDAHVAKHLFQNSYLTTDCYIRCAMEYLKDKARILVTHQIQFLREAHKILVLNEGKCVAFGTYEELMESGVNFMQYLSDTKPHDPKTDQLAEYRRMQRSVSFTPSLASSIAGSEVSHEEIRDVIAEEDEPKLKGETKMIGSIDSSIYWDYMKAGAGCFLIFVTLSSIVVSQVLYQGSDFWLTIWSVHPSIHSIH
ncbi:unnamed protein product [Medioppia subpectinata]|uniref:Uncharacterized protein n=1 Tax=Medioppia subpectinata TaxID=1979941 RepID=A0A7R9Q2H0_9ACAR|nr:unnamed protein product [Medioppia subpectinata]CAG2110175.1 unnamed protein product [Medioppia subpectinata]